MNNLLNFPLIVIVSSFLVMYISARLGFQLRKRLPQVAEDAHRDLDLIVGAVLTLLGLIVGFSFSMATNRYDQRKNYEEAEANAIGTEYVRADLLPAKDAAKVRVLLKEYLEQRILYYQANDEKNLQDVNIRTAQLQAELWAAVEAPAAAQPTPVIALAVSGMNDVLNSQGYTQAAWWNHIPIGAWLLMGGIAIFANVLIGYSAYRTAGLSRVLILPIVLCVAFFLIADIDSPRKGIIKVRPRNLTSLAQSLQH